MRRGGGGGFVMRFRKDGKNLSRGNCCHVFAQIIGIMQAKSVFLISFQPSSPEVAGNLAALTLRGSLVRTQYRAPSNYQGVAGISSNGNGQEARMVCLFFARVIRRDFMTSMSWRFVTREPLLEAEKVDS